MLQVVLPPAVALGGFSLMSSALTLNTPATMLLTVAWWGFELATGCRLSGQFALFPIPMNLTDIDLVANQWLLLAAGLLLAMIGTGLLTRRPLPSVED